MYPHHDPFCLKEEKETFKEIQYCTSALDTVSEMEELKYTKKHIVSTEKVACFAAQFGQIHRFQPTDTCPLKGEDGIYHDF